MVVSEGRKRHAFALYIKEDLIAYQIEERMRREGRPMSHGAIERVIDAWNKHDDPYYVAPAESIALGVSHLSRQV